MSSKNPCTASDLACVLSRWSGRLDSNQRPPAPKAGALPLRHAPTVFDLSYRTLLAESRPFTSPATCGSIRCHYKPFWGFRYACGPPIRGWATARARMPGPTWVPHGDPPRSRSARLRVGYTRPDPTRIGHAGRGFIPETVSRARRGHPVNPATLQRLAVALAHVRVLPGAADLIGPLGASPNTTSLDGRVGPIDARGWRWRCRRRPRRRDRGARRSG